MIDSVQKKKKINKGRSLKGEKKNWVQLVAESQTFLRAKRPQRRRARRNGCFRRLVFLLSCILSIKVKRGGRPYTFTANFNAFYLKLLRMEKIKLNDSHFFMPDWFIYPSVFCFCRWCFIFLLLLIKYEQWNIWSFRSNTRKWPGRLNFHCVSIINHWVGFHWVSVNEGCLNGAWCSYSNSNFALCTNLFDGRIRKKIENTKTATCMVASV